MAELSHDILWKWIKKLKLRRKIKNFGVYTYEGCYTIDNNFIIRKGDDRDADGNLFKWRKSQKK